ncbi:MAG: hypothetical protein R2729_31110 [Bryobacteraceae bacterium]
MRMLILLLLLQSVPGSQEAAGQESGRKLELLVTDAYGRPMAPKGVGLIHLASRKNFASRLVRLTATGLPSGQYWVRVWSPGYEPTDKLINVIQPFTRVRVGLPRMAGAFSDVSPALKGVIRAGGVPRPDRISVRLMGIFVSTSEDCPVGDDNSFKFPRAPGGKYILVGMSGEAVIAMKTIDVSDGVRDRQTVELQLDNGGWLERIP